MVAASKDKELAMSAQQLLASQYLRISTSSDVTGVEIAGALKNVLAIAAGIVEGMNLGNNCMAALVAQGCSEIRWLATKMGAKAATLSGLSGTGDIMLTCFVKLSRNRNVGVRLGSGEKLDDILASMNQIAEGVATAGAVIALAQKYNVKMPVLTAVARILDNELTPRKAVLELMNLPQVSDEVHADGNITEGDKNPGNVQDSAQKWNGERRESSTSDADLFKSLRNSTEELQKQVEKAKESLTEVAKKAVEKEKGGLSWGTENPPVQEQSRKGAKIHDFCFGIPYGGLLVGGGLLEFIITRNTTASLFGLLLGGAVLGLSITSLRVWKQGKSSVPYILGQAALTFILLARQLQIFSLTKNTFPTGLVAIISAAMLGFYSYVYISGGNPPSKKLKAASASQVS